MKSNKNFQKSKKPKPFDDDKDMRVKKVDSSSKKVKYFKKEIFDEIDEFEEIDLFGKNEDYLEDDDDIEEEEDFLDDEEDSDS